MNFCFSQGQRILTQLSISAFHSFHGIHKWSCVVDGIIIELDCGKYLLILLIIIVFAHCLIPWWCGRWMSIIVVCTALILFSLLPAEQFCVLIISFLTIFHLHSLLQGCKYFSVFSIWTVFSRVVNILVFQFGLIVTYTPRMDATQVLVLFFVVDSMFVNI